MRVLIESGADINKARDIGVTPLFIAAHKGHEAVVRALIKAGADVNKATDGCATPPFVAAQNGHEAVVRALIEAGADVGVAAPRRCSSPRKGPRGGGAGADRGGRGRQQGKG